MTIKMFGLSAMILALCVGSSVDAQQTSDKAHPKSAVGPVNMEWAMAVTGLTKENSAEVESALLEVVHTSYECKGCKVVAHKAGSCKGCGADLAKNETPALETAAANIEKSTITLGIASGHSILFSEIEKALKTSKVDAPRKTLQLPVTATLMLDGVSSEENSKALRKGLDESKLFKNVTMAFDPATKHSTASVVRNEAPVSLDQVKTLLARLAESVKLTDLAWNAPTLLQSVGG